MCFNHRPARESTKVLPSPEGGFPAFEVTVTTPKDGRDGGHRVSPAPPDSLNGTTYNIVSLNLPRSPTNLLYPPTGPNPISARVALLAKELRELEEGRVEPAVRRIVAGGVRELCEATSPSVKESETVLAQYQAYRDAEKKKAEMEEAAMDELLNACCSICKDGEVSPQNQIVFCEGCNVSVHQACYGVETVPEGDYFCRVCEADAAARANGDMLPGATADEGEAGLSQSTVAASQDTTFEGDASAVASPAAPLVKPKQSQLCELCPVMTGAFVPTVNEGKFVHVCCAKWHGMSYVPAPRPPPPLLGLNTSLVIEDLTDLKAYFKRNAKTSKCEYCKRSYGATIKCSHPDCDKSLHVTCARESGNCTVIHGEDCEGAVDGGWRLFCKNHSRAKMGRGGSTKPTAPTNRDVFWDAKFLEPPVKSSVAAKEHLVMWEEDEAKASEMVAESKAGAHCDVCGLRGDCKAMAGTAFLQCYRCKVFFHDVCYSGGRMMGDLENEKVRGLRGKR